MTKRIRDLQMIAIAMGILSFVGMLGLAGDSDFEVIMGERLHTDAYYVLWTGLHTMGIVFAYFLARVAEWARRLNKKRLILLQAEYGEAWFVKVYRAGYRFFKQGK